MSKLKVYNPGTGQFVLVDPFPRKGTKSFATPTVAGSGSSEQGDEGTFANRAIVRKLKVTPSTGSINSFIVEFYKSGSFASDKLEYQATASGTFIDNDVWFHEDEDQVSELHWKITNNSLTDGTFTIELTQEEFA